MKLTLGDKLFLGSITVGAVIILYASIFCSGCNSSTATEKHKPNYTITLFADNGNVIRICHTIGYATKDGGFVVFTDYNTGKEIEFSGTIEIEEL